MPENFAKSISMQKYKDMPVEYTNRRKEKYYLKKVPTKTGKIQYCPVTNVQKINPDDLSEVIPPGYEFYEDPKEARVYFRKIPVYNITDEEVDIIDSVMKKHKTVSDYIIDKSVNDINVYISSMIGFDDEIVPGFKESLYRYRSYENVLKFGKAGKTYKVQRFCYRSSVDDWIILEISNDLRCLAEKYCYHIDKDSLYDSGFGW